MGNGMNNNFMGSVNLSDEEMEEMNLEITHNEGAVSYTHLTLPTILLV